MRNPILAPRGHGRFKQLSHLRCEQGRRCGPRPIGPELRLEVKRDKILRPHCTRYLWSINVKLER